MKYKIVFDNGKPQEEDYKTLEEVKDALKEFYSDNKDNGICDAKVYQFNGDLEEPYTDITESQIINEFVADILNEVY